MKFRNIFIVSMFLIFILSLSATNAFEDNSTNSNIQVSSENTETHIDSINQDMQINSENTEGISDSGNNKLESGNQNIKFKSSSKGSDDTLKTVSNKESVKSVSYDSFEIGVPKETEIWGLGSSITMNISLPKNSKGKVSIYKDSVFIQKFDLSNKRLKTDGIIGVCEIYYQDNGKKDLYEIWYHLNDTKFGIKNFTFKYENGADIIEKSALINITYILQPLSTKINYYENSLIINTPRDIKGKVSVEIDGKKYKTYIKTYKMTRCIVINTRNQYIKLSPKLSPSKHKIRISYSGDEIYPSRTVEYTLTIIPRIEAYLYSDSNKKVSLKLPKNAKGKLVLRFYDSKKKLVKTFTRKLKKGKAIIVIPKRFYGKFSKSIASYSGRDYKVQKEWIRGITIDPPISVPETMLKGEKKFVSINLPGKKGVLKLYMYHYLDNGDSKEKVYSKRLVKGKARISLSRFSDKNDINYIKFVETLKNGKKVSYIVYKSCTIYKRFHLDYGTLYYGDAEIRIRAYGKGGKILKNKSIIVKINNKFVKKVKTNKYGYSIFKIPKKYKPKTYKITVKYKKHSLNEKIKIHKANKNAKKKIIYPINTVKIERAC